MVTQIRGRSHLIFVVKKRCYWFLRKYGEKNTVFMYSTYENAIVTLSRKASTGKKLFFLSGSDKEYTVLFDFFWPFSNY